VKPVSMSYKRRGRNKDILWLELGKGLIRYDTSNKTYQIIGNDNYSDNFYQIIELEHY
jgi:hypothetical protein